MISQRLFNLYLARGGNDNLGRAFIEFNKPVNINRFTSIFNIGRGRELVTVTPPNHRSEAGGVWIVLAYI
jgi:hypothetical protein